MTYAVVAHYKGKPEDADLIRDALLKMREHTLREPGNLLYIVHADTAEDAAFTLYEQYVDEAAFDAHIKSPYFAEHVLATVRPRLLERTVTFATVLEN